MSQKFPGNPIMYKKASVVISVYIVLSIYLTFSAIKYFLHGEVWMFDWKTVVFALVFALLFAHRAYIWMMRLDAQYGTGSGWSLTSTKVKLPELKVH